MHVGYLTLWFTHLCVCCKGLKLLYMVSHIVPLTTIHYQCKQSLYYRCNLPPPPPPTHPNETYIACETTSPNSIACYLILSTEDGKTALNIVR